MRDLRMLGAVVVMAVLASCIIDAPTYFEGDASLDASLIDASVPDGELAFDAMPNDPDAMVEDPAYHVGGTVSGMWNAAGVALRIVASGGINDILAVNANGSFTFPANLLNAASFTVTVETQPTQHNCSLAGNVGSITAMDYTGVAVSCAGPVVGLALSAPVPFTFDAGTIAYTVNTSVVIQETAVTVTAATATAITLNGGAALTSGVASSYLSMAFGNNTITVRADVGVMNRTYTITLNRGAIAVAQYVYAKASNTGAGDQFGGSVAISGDTMAIGAYQERSGNGVQTDDTAYGAGAVFVFRRTGSTWAQEAYLKASSIDGADHFGQTVSLSGDTLAVGAPDEDSAATGINGSASDDSKLGAGAVYVFKRTGSAWAQEAYVKASNTDASDHFGATVSLSADTLAVGADSESSDGTSQANNTAGSAGAVYVFKRSGSTWTQQAYLKAPTVEAGDFFGYAVSVDVDTLAVSAFLEDSCAINVGGSQTNNGCSNAGAIYVFKRTGITWAVQAYVKASNTEASDGFGSSVAISADLMLVGAMNEDSATQANPNDNTAVNNGAAYVYRRSGSTWVFDAYLKPEITVSTFWFGQAVGIYGDLAVVGVSEPVAGLSGAGAAHLFRWDGASWSQVGLLSSANAEGSDNLGISLALSRDSFGSGATNEDSPAIGVNPADTGNGASESGAGYLFR